jgi:hypothetical protein
MGSGLSRKGPSSEGGREFLVPNYL